LLARIHELIKDILRHPYTGIGEPEPLQHALSGYWSLRINGERRIVYRMVDDAILLAQLRYHY
jgi:toxin YoeB